MKSDLLKIEIEEYGVLVFKLMIHRNRTKSISVNQYGHRIIHIGKSVIYKKGQLTI